MTKKRESTFVKASKNEWLLAKPMCPTEGQGNSICKITLIIANFAIVRVIHFNFQSGNYSETDNETLNKVRKIACRDLLILTGYFCAFILDTFSFSLPHYTRNPLDKVPRVFFLGSWRGRSFDKTNIAYWGVQYRPSCS